MAPWVSKVFIQILPRILCIERPKKDEQQHDDDGGPSEVLTDVYHCAAEVNKFTRDYSADYGMPGDLQHSYFFFFFYHFTKIFRL